MALFVLICASAKTSALFAQSKTDKNKNTQTDHSEEKLNPTDAAMHKSYRTEYRAMIREMKVQKNRVNAVEKTASGVAALAIGFYGYYFDSKNTARRLAYSATQTAGVLLIGDSLYEGSAPNLLLTMDEEYKEKSSVSFGRYKEILVNIDRQKSIARLTQVGYTTGILSLLYAYNSFYERDRNIALRNVFGFLSVNFAAISGVSLYKLHKSTSTGSSVSFEILPAPTITMNF